MCRLLMIAMRKPERDLLSIAINALVEASRYDPYLILASRGKYSDHADGWGIAYVGYISESPVIGYHREINPLFSPQSRSYINYLINKLVELDTLYIVIHARRASSSEPIGVEHTHPYMYRLNGKTIWFAHNGVARKRDLAGILGENPASKTDSAMLGLYVSMNLSKCIDQLRSVDECIVKSYITGKKYIADNSAMNTALLLMMNSNVYLYLSHWVNSDQPELREYYSMISIDIGKATVAGSITIAEYLPSEIRESVRYIHEGVYRVEPGLLRTLTGL